MGTLTTSERLQYEDLGYVEPFPILDDNALEELEQAGTAFDLEMRRRASERRIRSSGEYLTCIDDELPWQKSAHVYAPTIGMMGAHPEIVDRITDLLGPDIILWGAQWVSKRPGQVHRWHVDIETLQWPSVNVWIGLTNVTQDSTLMLLPGTHSLTAVQYLAREEGFSLTDDEAVNEAAARHSGVRRAIVKAAIVPGAALIFHGREWHASRNQTTRARSALLLQYSAPSAQIRIPVTFDAPPIRWHAWRPPCLLVRGRDDYGVNRIDGGSGARLR